MATIDYFRRMEDFTAYERAIMQAELLAKTLMESVKQDRIRKIQQLENSAFYTSTTKQTKETMEDPC